VQEFISEDDLNTFEGWLKYQVVDAAAATPDELAMLRGLFDEGSESSWPRPSCSRMLAHGFRIELPIFAVTFIASGLVLFDRDPWRGAGAAFFERRLYLRGDRAIDLGVFAIGIHGRDRAP
jgi:hypothetical protein